MTFKIWGTESSINPPVGVDVDAVTMLATGGYVVTYRENQKIAFQLYDGNGAKVGGEHFVAGSTAAQQAPDVLAYDSEGHFVIAWTESQTTGRTIRTERFNFDGTSAGATTVTTTAQYDDVQLSQNGNGGYSLSYIEAGVPKTPRMANFASNGSLLSVDILTAVDSSQVTDVAWLGGSKHVVSYTDGGNGNTAFNIVDGGVVGSRLVVPEFTRAEVVALKDGNGPNGSFVILVDKGTAGIDATFYNAAGASSITIPISGAKPSALNSFSVTALKDGSFAVAYIAADGGDFGDVFVKVVSASGVAGPALKVNMRADVDSFGAQDIPSISEMADGRLSVSWHDGTLGNGIVSSTIVDARNAHVNVQGTSHNDIYAPSEFTGDVLDGGAGIDTLTFQGSGSGVAVNLATHSGSKGDAASDTFNNFENVLGSKFVDTLFGDGGSNALRGGAGNDVIRGGGGNDVIAGGAGTDKLYGGTGRTSRDTFLFDVTLNSASVANRNKDVIYDFGSKYDVLAFDHDAFTNSTIARALAGKNFSLDHPSKMSSAFIRFGNHALDRNDFFIVNLQNHKLYWDVDGSGSKAMVEIAHFSFEKNAGSISASDFYFV